MVNKLSYSDTHFLLRKVSVSIDLEYWITLEIKKKRSHSSYLSMHNKLHYQLINSIRVIKSKTLLFFSPILFSSPFNFYLVDELQLISPWMNKEEKKKKNERKRRKMFTKVQTKKCIIGSKIALKLIVRIIVN